MLVIELLILLLRSNEAHTMIVKSMQTYTRSVTLSNYHSAIFSDSRNSTPKCFTSYLYTIPVGLFNTKF